MSKIEKLIDNRVILLLQLSQTKVKLKANSQSLDVHYKSKTQSMGSFTGSHY